MKRNTGKIFRSRPVTLTMALVAFFFLSSCQQHVAQARLAPHGQSTGLSSTSDLTPVLPPETGAKNLELDYSVYAGGLRALSASLEMDLGKSAYDVALEAQTQGFIGSLFPWKARYETTGRTEGQRLKPVVHQVESTWKKSSNTVELAYDKRGVFKSKKETENSHAKPQSKDALAKSAVIASDAVDVLTGTLQILRNVDMTHGCTAKSQVFDGKRRFNIIFTDKGLENLRANKYSRFEGQARKCEITVEPVAGFREKDKKRGWLAVQEHTRERSKLPTIWLAPLYQKGPIVPVRMEIASEYGSVVAHLSRTDAK